MKFLIGILPSLVFLVLYKTQGIFIASLGLALSCLVSFIVAYFRNEKIPKIVILSSLLTILFSFSSWYFKNDAFIKSKPTVIYIILSAILIIGNLTTKRSLLQELIGNNIYLPISAWKKLDMMWALFFIFCAIINLCVALYFEQSTWVYFKIFGFSALTIVATSATFFYIYKFSERK